MQNLRTGVADIARECAAHRFDGPLATAIRLQQLMDWDGFNWEILGKQVDDLRSRIADAFAFRQFVVVDAGHGDLWLEKQPFGSDVVEVFPAATDDIEEAAKCLAVGRGTAVVFHLMRALEHVIQALLADMGEPYDPKTDTDWTRLLAKVNQHIAKAGDKQEFYRDALTTLTSVKHSWRNPTMHPKKVYTEEQAEEIWRAVRTFTRHVASGLSEG